MMLLRIPFDRKSCWDTLLFRLCTLFETGGSISSEYHHERSVTVKFYTYQSFREYSESTASFCFGNNTAMKAGNFNYPRWLWSSKCIELDTSSNVIKTEQKLNIWIIVVKNRWKKWFLYFFLFNNIINARLSCSMTFKKIKLASLVYCFVCRSVSPYSQQLHSVCSLESRIRSRFSNTVQNTVKIDEYVILGPSETTTNVVRGGVG